jgi:hypothetical protein
MGLTVLETIWNLTPGERNRDGECEANGDAASLQVSRRTAPVGPAAGDGMASEEGDETAAGLKAINFGNIQRHNPREPLRVEPVVWRRAFAPAALAVAMFSVSGNLRGAQAAPTLPPEVRAGLQLMENEATAKEGASRLLAERETTIKRLTTIVDG